MTPKPLSEEIITRATTAFWEDTSTVEKFEWWLQRGHSCERWLQFEWAFHLEQSLKDEFVVACEVDYVDVVCFQKSLARNPIWNCTPDAGFELKHYGNWWIDPAFPEMKTDIDKIDKADTPTMALVFVSYVIPKPKSELHRWISNQISTTKNPFALEDIEGMLTNVIGHDPVVSLEVESFNSIHFDCMKLGVYGYLKPSGSDTTVDSNE